MTKTETVAIDPVCGMSVTQSGAGATTSYNGKTYLFCCSNCKSKFDQDPEKYLATKAVPKAGGGCGCGCGPVS